MARPSADFRAPLARRARHVLVWKGRRRRLDADTGQAGTLVRASGAAAVDSFGGSLTMVHSAPRWQDEAGVVGLQLGATDGSLTEYLSFPFVAAPQAMSGVFDFLEAGTSDIGDAAAGAALASIGSDDAVGGSDPPQMYFGVTSAGQYHVTHVPAGPVSSVPNVPPPAIGDRVRLRWVAYADGSVQAWVSYNGGAETAGAASAANPFAAAWSAEEFHLNRLGTFQPGSVHLLGCVIMLGVQTRATLLEALA